jgi:hypothetical protein
MIVCIRLISPATVAYYVVQRRTMDVTVNRSTNNHHCVNYIREPSLRHWVLATHIYHGCIICKIH